MAADRGKAKKVVVRRLVDDIRYFADSVKEDAKKMMADASGLKAQWNDPQYQKFLNFMSELTTDLTSDTADLYDCASKIEEREIKGL